jgi:hypothetical protein
MNGDQPHIVVSYTTDQEGQDIRDEDVVRSINHRWCYHGGDETSTDQEGQDIRDEDMVRPINHRWCYHGGDETSTWKLKSWARCPTYGSCQYCLKERTCWSILQ